MHTGEQPAAAPNKGNMKSDTTQATEQDLNDRALQVEADLDAELRELDEAARQSAREFEDYRNALLEAARAERSALRKELWKLRRAT